MGQLHELPRSHADDALELPREVRLVGESQRERDVSELRQDRVREERSSTFDPQQHEVVVGR